MVKTRSAREKADNRLDQILDVVAELFREKGYVATSVRDIGEAVGLKQGALYYYIGNKENLLIGLHNRFIDHYLNRLETEVEAMKAPADERLRRAILIAMEIIQQYQAEVTVFLREEHNLVGEFRDEIVAKRDRVDAIIDGMLKEGQREGLFRDFNVKIGRLGLLGMCNWAYQWYHADGRSSAQKIAKEFADIFLFGITRDRTHVP